MTILGQKLLIDSIDSGVADSILEEVQAMPKDLFDRYDNPFEQKWTLRDKTAMPYWTGEMLNAIEQSWIEDAMRIYRDDSLKVDMNRHYAGLFVYDDGDGLGVHVDAGIHPISHLRKLVTVLLYIGHGQSDLEFWDGTHPMDSHEPQVYRLGTSIHPEHGMLVMFENTDYAWHGVARNHGEPRIVLTASYLSPDIFRHRNMRQRAYFVPRPNERWMPSTIALRDTRADAEAFHTAYRTGAPA